MRAPIAEHLRHMAWVERALVARLVATSLGRAAAAGSILFLIDGFLAAAAGVERPVAAAATSLLGRRGGLVGLGALLLLAYAAASSLNYATQLAQHRLVRRIELATIERLTRKLLSLSIPYIERHTPGDLVEAIRHDTAHLRLLASTAVNFFGEAALMAGLLLAALRLSPWLTLCGLVLVPLASLPAALRARRTLAGAQAARARGVVLGDIFHDLVRGIRPIQAYAAEDAEAGLALERAEAYVGEHLALARLRAGAQAVFDVLAGVAVVATVVLGGIEVGRGALGWPALVAFVVALRALHGAINHLNVLWIQLHGALGSIDRLADLLEARPDIADRPDAAPLPAPPRRIAFDGVILERGSERVLDGVAFEARAGETIGVVGPSGGGKTSLLGLLVRFQDPSAGRILFDGRDIREFRIADVRACAAVVTQEPFLLSTSVRENIRFGRPGATDADIEAAARAAGIHDELAALPDGYGTVVGQGGRGLSRGQEQRIAIARALLRDAPILLLDEATASLDGAAEAEVQRSIERLMAGRTCFVVAHRLSALRAADRIIAIEAGRVAGTGPHAALLETCPLYRRLWEAQLPTAAAAAGAAPA